MYRRYQQPSVKQSTRMPPRAQTPPPPRAVTPPLPPPKAKIPEKKSQNPILGWIPSALYNPETKKVLGMFSPEDLLLVGLIFLLLENDEKQDDMLIYALLYILISDYL